jgi:iron(III) transport system substrate-binding protein
MHVPKLPAWAIWKHEAYGSTHEPVGLAINRARLGSSPIPRTHAALTALLRDNAARWRGRVATYDVERAGLGFLLAAQDLMATARSWDLVRAIGECQPTLHADTQSMLVQVASGNALLAYNVLGSYAEAFARRNPEVEMVYFDDYTLVATRAAFVSRTAPNPDGARLWLDHLLSAPGQTVLAEAGGFYAIRRDITHAHSAAALEQRLGRAMRPITLGPGLLAHLDHSKHEAILRRWQQAIAAR